VHVTHVAVLQLTHRVETLHQEGSQAGLIELVLSHLDSGNGTKDLAFHFDVADVALFAQRREFPRCRPRTNAEHVVQFLTRNAPTQANHFGSRSRTIVLDAIDSAFITPELGGNLLLQLKRQT
jgi:hypothetical protein